MQTGGLRQQGAELWCNTTPVRNPQYKRHICRQAPKHSHAHGPSKVSNAPSPADLRERARAGLLQSWVLPRGVAQPNSTLFSNATNTFPHPLVRCSITLTLLHFQV